MHSPATPPKAGTFYQPPPPMSSFRPRSVLATFVQHLKCNGEVHLAHALDLHCRCGLRSASECAAAAHASVDKRVVDATRLSCCRHLTTAFAPFAVTVGSVPCDSEHGCDAQMASQHMNVARLYRDILKAATRFPSVKRSAIVRDIKKEFHDNKVLMTAVLPQSQADECAHTRYPV